jgi:hypothetical protein
MGSDACPTGALGGDVERGQAGSTEQIARIIDAVVHHTLRRLINRLAT